MVAEGLPGSSCWSFYVWDAVRSSMHFKGAPSNGHFMEMILTTDVTDNTDSLEFIGVIRSTNVLFLRLLRGFLVLYAA
jgi:hypothetical protein